MWRSHKNYHILLLDVITHRDSDKEILVLIGDFNALECLERNHIHIMVGAADLVGGVADTKNALHLSIWLSWIEYLSESFWFSMEQSWMVFSA